MIPGVRVRILEPFTAAFPDTYVIGAVEGSTAFLEGIPDGFANAFAFDYLEVIDE